MCASLFAVLVISGLMFGICAMTKHEYREISILFHRLITWGAQLYMICLITQNMTNGIQYNDMYIYIYICI